MVTGEGREKIKRHFSFRIFDIFSQKKHLTTQTVHPIIYIISAVLSADGKERAKSLTQDNPNLKEVKNYAKERQRDYRH